MTNEMSKLTKRLAFAMAEMVNSKDKSVEALGVFMGLGMALGMCCQLVTGRPVTSEKPMDVLKWAISLPRDSDEPKATLN